MCSLRMCGLGGKSRSLGAGFEGYIHLGWFSLLPNTAQCEELQLCTPMPLTATLLLQP